MAINIVLNSGMHMVKQRSNREKDQLLIQSYFSLDSYKSEVVSGWHVKDTDIIFSTYLIL